MARNFATAESIGKIKSKSYNSKYGPQYGRTKGKSMSDDEKDGAATPAGDTTPPAGDGEAKE